MARLRGARHRPGIERDLMVVLHIIRENKAGIAWAAIAVDVRQGMPGEPR